MSGVYKPLRGGSCSSITPQHTPSEFLAWPPSLWQQQETEHTALATVLPASPPFFYFPALNSTFISASQPTGLLGGETIFSDTQHCTLWRGGGLPSYFSVLLSPLCMRCDYITIKQEVGKLGLVATRLHDGCFYLFMTRKALIIFADFSADRHRPASKTNKKIKYKSRSFSWDVTISKPSDICHSCLH